MDAAEFCFRRTWLLGARHVDTSRTWLPRLPWRQYQNVRPEEFITSPSGQPFLSWSGHKRSQPKWIGMETSLCYLPIVLPSTSCLLGMRRNTGLRARSEYVTSSDTVSLCVSTKRSVAPSLGSVRIHQLRSTLTSSITLPKMRLSFSNCANAHRPGPFLSSSQMKKCSTWNTGTDLVISLRYSQNDKKLIYLGLGRRRSFGNCRMSRGLALRRTGWRPDSLPAKTWAFPREYEEARSARDCRSRSDKGRVGAPSACADSSRGIQ